MLAAAAGLAVLTTAGRTTPLLLLALTFLLGLGMALNLPAWQAIQPELVPPEQFPQAVALGGVNINAGRAVGPALGGLVVAAAGSSAVFALNAASFVGVLVVLVGWRRPATHPAAPRETLAGAVRAGFRYALHSLALRAVLIRALVFCLPVSAITALLPVVARGPLGLGSGGFGLLLGCFGLGSILSATALPRLRARWPIDTLANLRCSRRAGCGERRLHRGGHTPRGTGQAGVAGRAARALVIACATEWTAEATAAGSKRDVGPVTETAAPGT